MDKNKTYTSPKVKVIVVENNEVLCASTERYGVSGQGYGDDDWE